MENAEQRLCVLVAAECVGGLDRCLGSLTAQDAAVAWQLLVIGYGPSEPAVRSAVAALQAAPTMTIEYRSVDEATRAAALDQGLAAVDAPWVVLVRERDWVSAAYVRVLAATLEESGLDPTGGCGVLPVRLEGAAGSPARVHSYPLTRQLVLAGAQAGPRELTAALGHLDGLLLPTALVRRHGVDIDLELGEGEVLLARIVADGDFACQVLGSSSRAIYHRDETGDAPSRWFRPGADVASRALVAVQRIAVLPRGPAIDRVRVYLVWSVLGQVNRYLRAEPEAHPTVVADRRRRGLEELVDLRRLNAGVARDLAVLFTAVPYVDTSANVAARRVLASRRIVDVITNDMTGDLEIDERSEAIWAEFLDRREVLTCHRSVLWWPGATEFARRGMARIQALETVKGGPYRSVYSRVMHPTSHFLAALYHLRRPQVRWRAEFSDPVRFDIKGQERPTTGTPDPVVMADYRDGLRARGFQPPTSMSLHLWLETLAYALAEEIVFTNENQRDEMLELFPDRRLAARAARHAVVEHHPRPEPWLYHLADSGYVLPPDRVNLAYFGVFYATRGLGEVWSALQQLAAQDRERVMLHVFTRDRAELVAQLEEAGLGDVVSVHPYLSYPEYLNLAARADVLIVNDARTVGIHAVNPYLPSKWSDYAGSGAQVWGITEAGSVLSRQPLDHRSDLGDVAGALRVLAELVDRDRRRAEPSEEKPVVSVLLVPGGRGGSVAQTQSSLAAQTLPAAQFEVLVLEGEPMAARRRGLAAARGHYVTVVETGRALDPSYLHALVTAARSGTGSAVVSFTSASTDDGCSAVDGDVGKLIERDLARRVGYDETLGSGAAALFWIGVAAQAPARLLVVPHPDAHAHAHSSAAPTFASNPVAAGYEEGVRQPLSCLRALDGFAPGPATIEALIARMSEQQTAVLQQFLIGRPDLADRVCSDIAAAALGRVSSQELGRRLGLTFETCGAFTPEQ